MRHFLLRDVQSRYLPSTYADRSPTHHRVARRMKGFDAGRKALRSRRRSYLSAARMVRSLAYVSATPSSFAASITNSPPSFATTFPSGQAKTEDSLWAEAAHADRSREGWGTNCRRRT